MTLLQDLESRLAAALAATLGEPATAAVTAAADLRFGDYQSNAAMVLGQAAQDQPARAGPGDDRRDSTSPASPPPRSPARVSSISASLPDAYAAKAAALLAR